jgi:hypothetical protein
VAPPWPRSRDRFQLDALNKYLAGKLGSVDAEGRYYRVEEHPTTVVVRGVVYSLWVTLGVPVLCSGVLGADSLRVAAGLLLVGLGVPLGFRRSGLVVDRRTGRARRWWGGPLSVAAPRVRPGPAAGRLRRPLQTEAGAGG